LGVVAAAVAAVAAELPRLSPNVAVER